MAHPVPGLGFRLQEEQRGLLLATRLTYNGRTYKVFAYTTDGSRLPAWCTGPQTAQKGKVRQLEHLLNAHVALYNRDIQVGENYVFPPVVGITSRGLDVDGDMGNDHNFAIDEGINQRVVGIYQNVRSKTESYNNFIIQAGGQDRVITGQDLYNQIVSDAPAAIEPDDEPDDVAAGAAAGGDDAAPADNPLLQPPASVADDANANGALPPPADNAGDVAGAGGDALPPSASRTPPSKHRSPPHTPKGTVLATTAAVAAAPRTSTAQLPPHTRGVETLPPPTQRASPPPSPRTPVATTRSNGSRTPPPTDLSTSRRAVTDSYNYFGSRKEEQPKNPLLPPPAPKSSTPISSGPPGPSSEETELTSIRIEATPARNSSKSSGSSPISASSHQSTPKGQPALIGSTWENTPKRVKKAAIEKIIPKIKAKAELKDKTALTAHDADGLGLEPFEKQVLLWILERDKNRPAGSTFLRMLEALKQLQV
jgi:hypothetical protein